MKGDLGSIFGNDVHVEVENRLSRTLPAMHLQPISAGAVILIQLGFHLTGDLCQADGFFVGDLKIVFKMSLRNHETVSFSDRKFIRDDVEMFVFQDVCLGLYSAKYAIHVYPPQDKTIDSF